MLVLSDHLGRVTSSLARLWANIAPMLLYSGAQHSAYSPMSNGTGEELFSIRFNVPNVDCVNNGPHLQHHSAIVIYLTHYVGPLIWVV